MLKNLVTVAHALSDPTRLRIIKLLAVRELCVCQLEYLLGASQSRVSQNLTILKYAGLVSDTRRGRLVFYALNQPAFDRAIADLRALTSERDLHSLPEMTDELKRWQAFPADLDAICPIDEPAPGNARLPEAAGTAGCCSWREEPMKRLLFVCTGNSARSQMAEAFARHYAGNRLEVYSAGLEPSRINPRAVAVMAEKGISLDGQWSKGLAAVPADDMDLVITLCGDADARCPLLYGRLGRRHWPLPDPAKATGSDAEVLAVFRSVRDEIERRVQELAGELRTTIWITVG